MRILQPTRRDLIAAAPLALGLQAFAAPLATAAPSPSLRFQVIGDWGRDGAFWQGHVARAMKVLGDSLATEFVVSTGDNFYPWGVRSVSDPQWETSFERIYAPSLGKWFVVPGNHDYAGNIEAQVERSGRSDRWHMPHLWHDHLIARPGLPTVHLLFIDTVLWQGEKARTWGMFSTVPTAEMQGVQRSWLEDKLRNSPAQVKLVFGHHGIYSIGKHGGKKKMSDLDDLLRRERVTAYVHGHDHCMFHITQGPMHYLCSGAGSEMRPGYRGGSEPGCVHEPCPTEAEMESGRFPVWHSYFGKLPGTPFNLEGGVAVIEVSNEQVAVSFHDRTTRPRYNAVLARPARMTASQSLLDQS